MSAQVVESCELQEVNGKAKTKETDWEFGENDSRAKGLIRHWETEIQAFEEGIQRAKKRLGERP